MTDGRVKSSTHKFPMGGGGWFYVPKVRIPEAFLAAMLCAMFSFGVGRGRSLHGWAMGRTQARGAKPKASTTKRNARWSRCWWLVGRSWCIPFDGHRGHYLRRSSFLVDGVSFGDCWHGWSAPLLMNQFDRRLDMSGKYVSPRRRVGETEVRRRDVLISKQQSDTDTKRSIFYLGTPRQRAGVQ